MVVNFRVLLLSLASPLPDMAQHGWEEAVQLPSSPQGQKKKSGSCFLECPGNSWETGFSFVCLRTQPEMKA